ncbi:MAG: thioredoxin domain-containing protein [Steroidobacteraceae bacterium]
MQDRDKYFLICVIGCALILTALRAYATEANDPVVAHVGRDTVSQSALESQIADKLQEQRRALDQARLRLAAEYERGRSELLQSALEQMLDERALQLEIERTKMSRDELLAAVPVRKIEDAEIVEFYDQRQVEIGGAPLDQVRQPIVNYLQQRAENVAKRRYLDELRRKYDISAHLAPYRVKVADQGPSLGPPDAPVTVVEFADFQCPFCAQMAPTLRRLRELYPDQVRVVFRQLPLRDIHPLAVDAAQASLCADSQGKFWDFHDRVFADQASLSRSFLLQIAESLTLDMPAFEKCMTDRRYNSQIAADVQAAQNLFVESTPYTFVNGRLVRGAVDVEELRRIVDQEIHSHKVQLRAQHLLR